MKLDVENNYIENAQGGVIVHGYSGNRDGEQTIVIRSNGRATSTACSVTAMEVICRVKALTAARRALSNSIACKRCPVSTSAGMR